MPLALYDTWSRAVRPFTPIRAGQAGMYCCGPTVYDDAHIGNLRTYVFEDILRRVLMRNGYDVRHVVNITDVGHLTSDADEGEDKMEKGSRRTGESAWAIAQRYTDAFVRDWRALNLLEPTVWCRATDHIAEQIAFIETLERAGYVYRTDDGLYFDTRRQDDYGHLARLDRAGLQAGKRVAMGGKHSVTDFALWKFSPAGVKRQMEWDSPWGRGFPGWHIECSAMSAKYLGTLFDIHCGGEDHIAVHHSNEIAQTQAAHGTRLANYWLHGHFLTLDADAKMSKSSGDFVRLQTLQDRNVDPLAYRYLCLTAHYRSKLHFTWASLDAAQTALNRLRQLYTAWPDGGRVDPAFAARFDAEVNDDLNLPRALAVLWEMVRSDLPPSTLKATVDSFDTVLGLGLRDWTAASCDIPEDVRVLLDARERARAERDWASADRIRDSLRAQGWRVEDTTEGQRVFAVA
ncbi:cysteine--tRNA ligase [Burkholderia pseudomultivorans]|uniref:Cysteine--tRNA ligase n=1 Tax=Burkholderia pseudomultivorans TaxID=1207504 RepID=A0ABU2DZX5_9BURK|nr:cysteine--tRNA ligase [Burkholderia pseudomultivorans]MDR8726814.1 Cysteine--tRNA ligase [Burkholderia pseudomultivorans]MDR8736081.1 Cysteine--tRNA ligase [Burkholderia pseudomultivorans]MDR8742057.1 Cysteine--tRNA ligase [Burkholderia pseudomultivorans]MDR8753144.1 Cysteine--tRNA ligase [Burkholderia pseudomultivorans]MDR8778651.1 Cysteine--tRNA ligase [Burkholderia pseudomultivorans]